MDRECEQDGKPYRRGDERPDEPRPTDNDDGADRLFDPEALDPIWWTVRSDVDYVPGGTEAEHAAQAVCAVYRLLRHRSHLDRVDMITDVEGNPFLIIGLNTAGVFEMVSLLRAGAHAAGLLGNEATDH